MTRSVKENRIEVLRAAYGAASERIAADPDARVAGRAGTRDLSGGFAVGQAARNAYEAALQGEAWAT